ncbi:MAG: hypothetical protein COB12_02360 [Flavobacterium sp.]|nr:MAG: hypothetical protein COB12_02360 [Flavobacterium sp.]
MRTIIYSIIYNSKVNYIIRNISYYVIKLLPETFKIPVSGVLNLKTKNGTIKIATNQTSYLTKVLFWKGYKYFEYSEIFEDLSKSINCFLDIGANIGYYSLIASKTNRNIKIFAFEPAKGPKHYLNKNIELNNFQNNIKPVDIALSNKEGIIDFYEVESKKYKNLKYNLSGEHNAGTKTKSRNFVKKQVKTTTLSNFIKHNKIENIDIIKIDTEGTEVDILKSGKNEIKQYQPIIICETLFNTTENELDDFFSSLGYVFYNHTDKGLVEVDTIKRTEDNEVRNCFFVPKNKIKLINKYIAKTSISN